MPKLNLDMYAPRRGVVETSIEPDRVRVTIPGQAILVVEGRPQDIQWMANLMLSGAVALMARDPAVLPDGDAPWQKVARKKATARERILQLLNDGKEHHKAEVAAAAHVANVDKLVAAMIDAQEILRVRPGWLVSTISPLQPSVSEEEVS